MEITEEMCCKLLGRGVFYTDKDGRQRHGVLKSISRDRGIPYAEIKRKSDYFGHTRDTVWIGHLFPSNFSELRTSGAKVIWEGKEYRLCEGRNFEVGSQVVWQHPTTFSNNPPVGKVKMILESFSGSERFALVEFEHIKVSQLGGTYDKLVFEDHCVPLETWVKLHAPKANRKEENEPAVCTDFDRRTVREPQRTEQDRVDLLAPQTNRKPGNELDISANVYSTTVNKGLKEPERTDKGPTYSSKLKESLQDKSAMVRKHEDSIRKAQPEQTRQILEKDNGNQPHQIMGASVSLDQVEPGVTKPMKMHRISALGIQGSNNSCYLDSSVFALFAYTTVLDEFLLGKSTDSDLSKKAKATLREEILKPLRRDNFVPSQKMGLLRKLVSEFAGDEYCHSYMDAESLIIALFDLLKLRFLFEYDTGEGDFIHQIMLPMSWTSSERKPFIPLQSLLVDSFVEQEVALKSPIDKAFLIKLPVSNGVLVPCSGVIPNLTLDLTAVTGRCTGVNESNEVHLSAVILLRSSHFVAIAKSRNGWMAMNSNPTTSTPELMNVPNLETVIKAALIGLKSSPSSEVEDCKIFSDYRLFRDSYICIYTNGDKGKDC